MAKQKLTKKEQIFVDEYLLTMNAEKAALAAGYAESTARKLAPLWIGKNRQNKHYKKQLAEAIAEAMEKRSERTKIDSDFVLQELAAIWNADICDIIDDLGQFKPVSEWTPIWRKLITAADIQELFDGFGKEREKIGEVVKVRFIDKLKALELVGKHVNVNAFQENHRINGDLSELLPEGFNLQVIPKNGSSPS